MQVNQGVMGRREEVMPVYYCKDCLSLRIMSCDGGDGDLMFCDDCGCTDIGSSSFDDWDLMYRKKYGESFIEKKDRERVRKRR